MISQQLSSDKKLPIMHLFQPSRSLWHTLLLVVVLGCKSQAGISALAFNKSTFSKLEGERTYKQGFNTSVLSFSHKLPAHNLNGRSSITMLRIAEHFRQSSDS